MKEDDFKEESFWDKALPMLEIVGMVATTAGIIVGGSALAAYSFWGVSLF
jgi:hypothetical protein